MIYLVIIFLSFLTTVILTPTLIDYLIKNDLVDKPNGEVRRVHSHPIPRMGGIIIFSVILLVTFVFYQDIYSKKFFILGLMLVFGLGFEDDLRGVNWQIKFVVQSVAAIMLIMSLGDHNLTIIKLLGYTLPPGLNYIILFLLIVGLLNSFNLMDGMDGLVSGYSLIVASMCFLLSIGTENIFLLILASSIIGTTLGFLKYNGNPARIFLGDSGSLTLGYLVAGLVISISGQVSNNAVNLIQGSSKTIDMTFIIIALNVPITDTVRVLFFRIYNKQHPFLADSSHLHHILYGKNINHKTVVVLIHLISVLFVLLAIFYARFSKTYAVLIFALLLVAFFFIKQIFDFAITKDRFLNYAKLYYNIPAILINIYKKLLLPVASIFLLIISIFLIFFEINEGGSFYRYFLYFLIFSLLYAYILFEKKRYYSELLVLINIIMFFIITGFNGFFYKLYRLPLQMQVNINQIFILIFLIVIIFFVLFKERIANLKEQFLSGTDLILSVVILFIYIAVQFLKLPESYLISDTLLRSFLVFLFYKIIIYVNPRVQFSLYYTSFLIALIALLKTLF